jgi:hypothetical protein
VPALCSRSSPAHARNAEVEPLAMSELPANQEPAGKYVVVCVVHPAEDVRQSSGEAPDPTLGKTYVAGLLDVGMTSLLCPPASGPPPRSARSLANSGSSLMVRALARRLLHAARVSRARPAVTFVTSLRLAASSVRSPHMTPVDLVLRRRHGGGRPRP